MKVLLILAVALLHLAAANPNPDTNVDVQVTVNGKPIDVANSGSTGANIFVQTLPYFHLLVSHHTLQGNYWRFIVFSWKIVNFLTHSLSGNFAETRDWVGLTSCWQAPSEAKPSQVSSKFFLQKLYAVSQNSVFSQDQKVVVLVIAAFTPVPSASNAL